MHQTNELSTEFSRREMLRRSGMGFGALGLGVLLGQDNPSRASELNPLDAKAPLRLPPASQSTVTLALAGPGAPAGGLPPPGGRSSGRLSS